MKTMIHVSDGNAVSSALKFRSMQKSKPQSQCYLFRFTVSQYANSKIQRTLQLYPNVIDNFAYRYCVERQKGCYCFALQVFNHSKANLESGSNLEPVTLDDGKG